MSETQKSEDATTETPKTETTKPEAAPVATPRRLTFMEKTKGLADGFTRALQEIPEIELALIIPVWCQGLDNKTSCYRCDPKHYGHHLALELAAIGQLQQAMTAMTQVLNQSLTDAVTHINNASAEAEETNARVEALRAELSSLELRREQLLRELEPPVPAARDGDAYRTAT